MCDKAENQSRQCKRSTETFIVVWLDKRFEDELSYQAISITAIQQAGYSVKTFVNIDAFVDFITDMEDETIISVISDEFWHKAHLSFIHDLTQIISIFVICQDDQMKNNEWQKDFYKVHSVLNNTSKLIDSLKRERKIIEHNQEHIFILDCSTKRDLNRIEPDFMYLHIFKELILEVDYDIEAKHDFIEYCHNYGLDNPADLRVADEIREGYNKHSPIWWYTGDTFVFRLVNRSLRDLNAMMIWKLRLFIKDVHQTLEQLQIAAPVAVMTLFRGQSMSKETFERLKRSVGGLLAFNSFLSTSAVENVARSFILGIDENHPTLVAIIFEIHVDTSMKTSSPFASIDHLSQMREGEILFSMLTIFRIDEIHQSEDGIWHVQLKMTMDDDEELRQLTEYIRRESSLVPAVDLEIEKTITEIPQDSDVLKSFQNMFKFISIMARIGQDDDARRILLARHRDYFDKDSIDSTNPLYSSEDSMNFVERLINGRNNVENYLQKVEDTLIHSPPSDKSELANLYKFAANNTKQLDQALDYHMHYFKLLQETECVTDMQFIQHHLSIGKIYFEQDRFDNALVNYELALQKTLDLQQPIYPVLGECYNQIGFVYQKLGDFEKALEYHQKSLHISYRSLPRGHPQLLDGHSRCATSLIGLSRYDEAHQHFEKGLEITRSYSGHKYLTETLQQVAEVFCRRRTDSCNSDDLNELISRLENLSE